MEWWVWVLITAGVIIIGALKLVVFNKWLKKRASKKKFIGEE